MAPQHLSFQFIREITDDFSRHRILGEGDFGVVYKGVTKDGQGVAVKKFKLSSVDLDNKQFENELHILMELNHENTVKILGYCYEIEKIPFIMPDGRKVFADDIHTALCFEYLHNGSLEKHLCAMYFEEIDWHMRFKIIKGISEGLKYMHKDLEKPIYHLNLSPRKILLDKNMVPKIAGFGLSKILGQDVTWTTRDPCGTPGYLPPEYIDRGEISGKFDIFSLGVIIIQIVSGLASYPQCLDMPSDEFIGQVRENWRNKLQEACSSSDSLLEEYCRQVETCTQIALNCLDEDSHKRPDIVMITEKLDGIEVGVGKFPDKGCGIRFSEMTVEDNSMEMRKESKDIIVQHQDTDLLSSPDCSKVELIDAREISTDVTEELIVGREEEKGKIISLLESSSKKISILPIHGIGGIGKTTFSRLIYNDSKFKCYSKAWVHVSHSFDLNKIRESIISQLSEKENQANERHVVNSSLRKLLHGKNIMIVLDDLWEDNQFQLMDLKDMLYHEDSKIIVLVTTRNESVAERICTNLEPYKILPLTNDMCWDIIRQRSGFGARDDKEKLRGIGQEIAQKCAGVALAAQCLGLTLRGKNFDQWMKVNDSDIWSSYCTHNPTHMKVSSHVSNLVDQVNSMDRPATPSQRKGISLAEEPCERSIEVTPVSSSLGAMGPLFRKLDLLLAPKYRLRRSIKHAIKLLKEDLEDIAKALVEQSVMDAPNHKVKYWMHEARELSYHIEDVIDTMMLPHTAADGKVQSVHGHKVARIKIGQLPSSFVLPLFHLDSFQEIKYSANYHKIPGWNEPRNGPIRWKLTRPKSSARIAKIAELRTLLWEASERYQRYQLDDCVSNSRFVFSGRSLRIPVACHVAADLVGIDGPRNELTTRLTDQAEQQLKIICVVGPAGVGKTALVKQLYHELRGQFECRAFVRVPRKPHMSRFLWGMLSQIQRPNNKQNLDAFSVQSLIHNIREHLQNKRYFIVIDGLWEAQVWDIMNSAFPEGHNCSRIMITCEVNSVAAELCSYHSVNVLELKPLGSQDSEKLFFDRISVSDIQCPDQLKEVSCRILRESGGLPLATITFAGLLASQLDNSDLWYHLRQFISNLANISSDDMLKGIVNFCYDSLPQYLKTCLLYITMYPEGCTIRKVDLLKQWIAEGFISATTEGKQRVAENYFDELVNRGMIQPEKIIHGDEVLSCTVHHIVFALLMHKSREENFITAVDYSETTTEFCMKAHRLSLHFSRAQYAEKPKVLRMSQVRSLAFFGLIRCMPSAMEFKVLRVLILELWPDCIGPRSLNLSRISKLCHLRYLKISSYYIFLKLQPPIQGLKLLETLEIDARVSEIDISCLPSLLHLSLQDGTKLPDGIDRIISLQTLQYFDLGKNSEDNIRSLGELINLRDLHITCSTALSDENLKRKLVILAASLGRLANLKSITLDPGAIGKTMFVDHPVAMFSTPSIFLQRLELLSPICIFSRLPEWIGELKSLRILKIVLGVLLTSDIDILTGLPDLTVLSLCIRQPNLGTVVFSSGALPVLKYFKYTCGTLRLAFEEEALPNLQRLKLCFNICRAEYSSHMISGTERLSNLKEISVNIGAAAGAKEYILRAAESWFKDAIHKHPSLHVCLNVKNVGRIKEESRPSGLVHGIIYCLGVLVLVSAYAFLVLMQLLEML